MKNQKQNQQQSTPMDTIAAARIQRAEARANNGKVSAGGVAARAQRAAAKNK